MSASRYSFKSLGALLLGLLLMRCGAATAADLRIVTEDLPPYSMIEKGKATGMSTEIVQAVLAQVGLQTPIEVLPWARAYDLALHVDNVLIFSIARTPERETLFNWVGIVAQPDWYLYCRAERPVSLNALDDARRYQIATVQDDVGEQYLVAHGFEVGRQLQSSNKYEQNYQKLKSDHVDLWISDSLNAAYLARQNGDDPTALLTPALALPELSKDGLSMAFSRATPSATVERFRQGLDAVRRNGTYAAIVKRWLAASPPGSGG
jgi:polar amino acid transport system substrate-binding protein